MDITLVLGIIIGMAAVVTGMIIKGASMSVLINPEAMMIIFVGTFAATMNSFPKEEFFNIPKILGVLFKDRKNEDPIEIIRNIVELSKRARREGLLSLDQTLQSTENQFLKRGLGMVVDGMEQEYIREVLEAEIESMEERHRICASIFSTAGSSSPTLGVLGAVVGLIGALSDISDTAKLCESIASAFVATLFGIFLGYVVCHPFSTRLKRKSAIEISGMRIIVEGVLSIQSGENPRNVELRLSGMLKSKDRIRYEAISPNNN